MDNQSFPTKGNLILAKNSLALAKQGYELMDKKRNILIRELMGLVEQAEKIQAGIRTTFTTAYAALQHANMELGITFVADIARNVPVEDGVEVKLRSIMGAEIPLVRCSTESDTLPYAFFNTAESLDIAKESFEKVKELTLQLAMVENSAYQLASNIRKAQKRANALKNITIPKYEALVKEIANVLEEKEREEFTRLKVIKRMHG